MNRKVALVFPGQGSQQAGMLDGCPENDDLDRLLDAAEALTGMPLRKLAREGSAEELADTRIAQPLLYLADWAWGTGLLASGIDPVAVAGHSLGELAALAVADVYSVEAGLELVVERSRLMAAAVATTSGSMSAVIGMDGAAIAAAIEGLDGVWVANDNSAGQVVISGTTEAVAEAANALAEAGARRVVPLAVAGAFHSPLMAAAAEGFSAIVAQAEFGDALIPVYQNTAASAATDAEVIRERLMAQITSPVRWTETMQAFVADGITHVIEAGPGAVLTGLAKRIDGVTALSADAVGIEQILEEVL
ncbi:MAG TPA: ACP S-malonyltransferase [Coriobacteriia bacterium]|nr:ACP S-malonyltransferase [Coriobacteriia bacterium]